MNTAMVTNPVAKKAIDALQAGDKNAWFELFTTDAQLFDDGNKIDLKGFSESALGHERFTSIDKVENEGLNLYGKFHSDKWGDFKTYFKFHINGSGKINRGRANVFFQTIQLGCAGDGNDPRLLCQ